MTIQKKQINTEFHAKWINIDILKENMILQRALATKLEIYHLFQKTWLQIF